MIIAYIAIESKCGLSEPRITRITRITRIREDRGSESPLQKSWGSESNPIEESGIGIPYYRRVGDRNRIL